MRTTPNINILKRLATLMIEEVRGIEGSQDAIHLGNGFVLDECVQAFEKNVIRYALEIADNNQVIASRLLGVKHTTLNQKIKRYKLFQPTPQVKKKGLAALKKRREQV